MDFYKDKYLFFLTLSIISCIFVHDFRLESSSVIIGVTGLSAWEAHLFSIVVVYCCRPCKNRRGDPLFCKARRFDVDST
jgi:hypothetical protein